MALKKMSKEEIEGDIAQDILGIKGLTFRECVSKYINEPYFSYLSEYFEYFNYQPENRNIQEHVSELVTKPKIKQNMKPNIVPIILPSSSSSYRKIVNDIKKIDQEKAQQKLDEQVERERIEQEKISQRIFGIPSSKYCFVVNVLLFILVNNIK